MRFNFCYALSPRRETCTIGSQKASGNQASFIPYISKCEEQQYHNADFEQDPVNISDQRTINLAYSIPQSSNSHTALVMSLVGAQIARVPGNYSQMCHEIFLYYCLSGNPRSTPQFGSTCLFRGPVLEISARANISSSSNFVKWRLASIRDGVTDFASTE